MELMGCIDRFSSSRRASKDHRS